MRYLTKPEGCITVAVTVASRGRPSNAVPGEARAEIDVRFSSVAEGRRIENAILSLKPFDERAQVVFSGGINRPPLERTEKVVALYERGRKIAGRLNFDLGEARVGGASEGNFLGPL